ncbi:MAG TPA: isomerizing glutamine--fructose-6-phosphate transaminase [Candidatus Angelobacter sp.]
MNKAATQFASKDRFPHYMLKEIYEQPDAVHTMIEGCLDASGNVVLPDFALSAEEIRRFAKITIAASGSSRHAGLVGEFMLERMTGLPVEVDFASQYCYRDPVVGANELTVFISQSGTTIDTIAALHEARRKGSKSLAICNVPDTPLTQGADATLLTYAGDEIAVAATKSFTTQLTALFLLAAYFAQIRGKSQAAEAAIRELRELPALLSKALATDSACRDFAETFSQYKDFIYVGRDIDYPIALEGALKLKEISYIHAEGYPTGELKHGPTALINEHLPIVILIPQDQDDVESILRYGKSLSNLREFAARNIPLLALATEDDHAVPKITPFVLSLPHAPVLLQPIIEVVPLQFLAYHSAVLGGHNVDQPRNLSKSVVVE